MGCPNCLRSDARAANAPSGSAHAVLVVILSLAADTQRHEREPISTGRTPGVCRHCCFLKRLTHFEESTSSPLSRLRRRHWAGLVRLLGAVILVVALAAAIVGMLAIGVLTIGGVAGNTGPVAMSRNWAGYAATGGSYTAVSGPLTVPDFSASSPTGLDATWVGIGGIDSRDLIQAGTQQQTSGAGQTQYSAWVETLPQPSRTVPLVIHAGDSISVSLSEQSRGNWLVSLTNNSTGQTYQDTVQYNSSNSSADWIEEAPSAGRGGVLPLDDFGTITITGASAVKNGQNISLAVSAARAIQLDSATHQRLATTSAVGADGSEFQCEPNFNP